MILAERRKQAIKEIKELGLAKEIVELEERKAKLLAAWERRLCGRTGKEDGTGAILNQEHDDDWLRE